LNKIRPYQIAIVFVAVIVATFFGYQLYASKMIDNKVLTEIEPGNVTLLGVDAGGEGYKIIVSNEIAQLVQSSKGPFEAPEMGGGADEGDATDKRHVPLKEMAESLQGNTTALSELVTAMNDDLRKLREELPPSPIVWKAEDLDKALHGDKKLEEKLVRDTNANLDGTPADFINPNALYAGIVIDIPVPVKVMVKGAPKTLVAHVRVPYQAEFTKKVVTDLNNNVKSLKWSPEEIKGYYLQEADLLKSNPANRENVAKSLAARIDPALIRAYADPAERILGKTKVILNETCVKDAHRETVPTDSGKTVYDLVLDLTDEGRDRLWKYSRHRVGTQLLLIVNGVAIAAPFVRHELEQKEITITQMVDPDLVDDAVDTIRKASKKSG